VPLLLTVEMAGIEPASERIDPRISTSLVGCLVHQLAYDRQKAQLVSRWNPKVPLSHN
jgi:hypothetical protein